MDVEHLWFSSQPGGTATNTTSSLINQKEDGSDASEDQMVETLANMADKRLYKLVKWCKSLPLFKNIVVSALPSISYIVLFVMLHKAHPSPTAVRFLVWAMALTPMGTWFRSRAFRKMHLENILPSHFWDFKSQKAFKIKICHISGVFWPILFKICVQVAKRSRLTVCYMAFAIKGQTKAAVAFKGINGVY